MKTSGSPEYGENKLLIVQKNSKYICIYIYIYIYNLKLHKHKIKMIKKRVNEQRKKIKHHEVQSLPDFLNDLSLFENELELWSVFDGGSSGVSSSNLVTVGKYPLVEA